MSCLKTIKRLILLIVLTAVWALPAPAVAQGNQPQGPTYIVQPGDTLYEIALRFGITLEDLQAANDISDPSLLAVGQALIIPGLEGIQGVLTTQTVALGDTWRGLRRQYQLRADTLARLNHLASPTELYVGAALIVPQNDSAAALYPAYVLARTETPLEAAVRQNLSPWTLALPNQQQPNPARLLPEDVLYLPGAADENPAFTTLPPLFQSVSLDDLPLYQGATAEIIVTARTEVTASGVLADYPLHFFPLDASAHQYVALQGVHALLPPGLYPIRITLTDDNGESNTIEQMVIVKDGGYPHETLIVPAETIDPTTNEAEYNWLYNLVTGDITPERYWDGKFSNPSFYEDCFTSRYGLRRTYKGAGSDLVYEGFHSGLDFCGGEGLPITAPAAGRVVFSGLKTIRGNATIIDHGWGVYSGIWHQSETFVKTGDWVEQGQQIGLVGGTGRVTGAHLHWEIWVNGVQVNPMIWLNQTFP